MALEQRAIGRRIAELREDRRLTQPAMAERVGVSLRGYQKWEAGVAAPNWRNLEQLAEALGVTADDLIGAGDNRHEPVAVTLDRIEAKLDRLLELAGATSTELPGRTSADARDAIEHFGATAERSSEAPPSARKNRGAKARQSA